MVDVHTTIMQELARLRETKTYKYEVPLQSPQAGVVRVNGREVVMLASNNYLGLSNHPSVKKAAVEGIRKYGYGVASVRFICGTQDIHFQLEKKISKFVGCEDTILFSSCFAANEGFFASLTNERLGFENYRDVYYSDRLNHASIIDGQRLCRAEVLDKKIYNHADVGHLEQLLEEDRNKDYRFRIIATDGVFSMEGDLAPLDKLVGLAHKYNAMLLVDDSHGIGVVGKTGRGTPEEKGALGTVDVLTGTLGKAIGGASGGYISGKKEIIEYLRQKSRPYTFSNPSLTASDSDCVLDTRKNRFSLLAVVSDHFRGHRHPNIIHPFDGLLDGLRGLLFQLVTYRTSRGRKFNGEVDSSSVDLYVFHKVQRHDVAM